MRRDGPRNLPASVRQRLLTLSREQNTEFNLILTWYGIERLLYRLSRSRFSNRFILKGAMLLNAWADRTFRPTQDVDFLGFGDASPDALAEVFREVCAVDVEPDGLVFDSDTVRVEAIRDAQEYGGLRVSLTAFLGKARIAIRADVGFGDAVTPEPATIDYPVLLDSPAPRIWACPPETVIAEKVQAMVALGILNSRMKDFYDVYRIARTFAFDGNTLAAAIRATFDRRGTPVPSDTPTAFTEAFTSDAAKRAQWTAFLRRTGLVDIPTELEGVLLGIRDFVTPALHAASSRKTLRKRWNPGGPWVPVR